MMCWFKKKEVEEVYDRSLEEQVRNIRRRIEEQRALLGYTQTQSSTTLRNEPVLEKPSTMEEKQKRNQELDDIKAKLLGRKK